jgi:hypothetical protein
VTLLALLAIPSFIAFCLLAITHTLQTMSPRLAESVPLPSEALLQEFFPAATALRAPKSGAALIRAYDHLLNNGAPRSRRLAFSRESNVPRFMRLPASFTPEYRRTWSDLGFRNNPGNPEARNKPFAARNIFTRRRPRLGAMMRRPRTFSAALNYSYS